jgi:microcystin-dependent protein
MSFNFPPKGWALCNGQTLPINQNQALFSLLGTTYGGNGQTTFALPDLRGRTAMHMGSGHIQGEKVGQETNTITAQTMPAHVHPVNASSLNGDQAFLGILAGASNVYRPLSSPITLNPATVTNAGGSQPHENRQPYLTLSWCIALQGIFPSRN